MTSPSSLPSLPSVPARRGFDSPQSARVWSKEATKSMLAALAESRFGEALLYLNAGANPNALDASGAPPLSIAAGRLIFAEEERLSETLALISELAQKGAAIDHTGPRGSTALLHAASSNNTAAASLLLALGANPALPNHEGFTPLMAAALNHNVALAASLLKAGAAWVEPLPDVWRPSLEALFPHRPVAQLLAAWTESQALREALPADPRAPASGSRL